jgi:hypothetical protein
VAQQTPLDSTTYGLASMLLSQVTALGGIGTEPNSDEAQEQLTLAVSITGACVGECKSPPSSHLNKHEASWVQSMRR